MKRIIAYFQPKRNTGPSRYYKPAAAIGWTLAANLAAGYLVAGWGVA